MGNLSFDGKGINLDDQYRSRLATFTQDHLAKDWGQILAAAPELLEALKAAHARLLALSSNETEENANLDDIEAAIAKAEGRA